MDDAVALRAAGQPRLTGAAIRVLKDEKLAAMVAGGNDDAFTTLYRRHHQAVYRYCLSILRQEADARDALQSSMVAALASLRARPIEGAFKPWLFRIAHNQSISIIRGRTREAPSDAPPAVVVTDDPETREELRTLVSDLGALPERQRGAIVMRELSGLSYAEIAAALGTSEAGGKQLVYEARTALQDLRDGHEMSCELVRERISAQDRRLLRGRKVRSHLRGCQPCRDFEDAIRRRRPAFALLAPPLAPFFSVAVLEEVFAGGGAGGGAGGAGAAAGATGLASGGVPIVGPAAMKLVAAAVVTGAIGVGAYEGATAIFAEPASSPAAAAEPGASAGQPGSRGANDESGPAGQGASGRETGGNAEPGHAAGGRADSGSPGQSAAGKTSEHGNAASPGTSGGPDGAPGSSASGGNTGGDTGGNTGGSTGGNPGGNTGGNPGGGPADPPTPPSPPPDPPSPPGGGGGSVPPGTPPGHGGTPPGHGGTPPGQAGGGTPPGHIGNPGHGGGRP